MTETTRVVLVLAGLATAAAFLAVAVLVETRRSVMELPDCRRCNHPAEVHEHWRGLEYCGVCGRDGCPDYLGLTWWRRVRSWLSRG